MADPDVFTLSAHELRDVKSNLERVSMTLTGEHQLRAMRLRDFLETFDPQENSKLQERIESLEDDLKDVARMAPLQPVRDALDDAFKDARWGANITDMVTDALENWRAQKLTLDTVDPTDLINQIDRYVVERIERGLKDHVAPALDELTHDLGKHS